MIGGLSLARVNRMASIAILPLMLLAIAVFSRSANRDGGTAPALEEGQVVVANLRLQTLSFIDLGTGTRRELALPGGPHEMVEGAGRVYVTLGRADLLVEVDPQGPAIVRSVRLEGEPHGLAVEGTNLLVTLDRRNEVVVIDMASLSELRRWPTGSMPHAIAANGNTVVVTDSKDSVLRQIEPGTQTVTVGQQPESVAIGDGWIATADAAGGSVSLVPGNLEGNVQTVPVGGQPVRVAIVAGALLVVVQGKDELAVIEPMTGGVDERRTVEPRPDGICETGDARHVAITSNATGAVEFFSVDGWRRAGRVTLSAGLGSCLWVRGR